MTDFLMPIAFSIVGCFIGAIICALISSNLIKKMRLKWEQVEVQKDTELMAVKQSLEQKNELIHTLEKEALLLEQQFTTAQTVWQEKDNLLRAQKTQMENEFKQLAQDIMGQQQQKLAQENEKQLGTLLTPLGNQIKQFQDKVERSYQEESKERFSLVKEIKNLQQLNQKISDDAVNLTHALKGQNKLQGGWGEVILERILERSGLEKGREYEVQGSYVTEDGRRLQPDVVVNLPEGKQIIIDSKMVLVSYLAYVEAETEEDKTRALKQHLDAIKRHIKELSAKSYAELPGIKSLDFVLLFIPVEAAFGLAIQTDNSLFSEAFDKNIIIAGPSNLLATLRTIQNIWRNEKQSQNAIEIAKQAGAMYDKFVSFIGDMDDVGQRLEQANRSYQGAVNKLHTGRGSLVSKAEKLKIMGAKTSKQIEDKHLTKANADMPQIEKATALEKTDSIEKSPLQGTDSSAKQGRSEQSTSEQDKIAQEKSDMGDLFD
ncbi:DNA recombination protein RmuC [Marinomonas agarivorans]|nr:DNA recombination protein RmuC [Marinomonas agarivorans]